MVQNPFKVSKIKQWIQIFHSSNNRLIWQVHANHSMTECPKEVNKRHNWVLQKKIVYCNARYLLYSSGFGYIWEQQTVTNKEKFLRSFETRCKDSHM